MKRQPSRPFDVQKREQWLAFVQELSPETEPRAAQLMGQMRMVAHALYRISENSLAASELSYAKFRLLTSLLFSERFQANGALHPSEISEKLGTSRNTISSLIRDLENDKLIERKLDQADRRRFLIRLTPAGREIVSSHAAFYFRAISRCFDHLTTEEQKLLSDLLEKLETSLISSAAQLSKEQ